MDLNDSEKKGVCSGELPPGRQGAACITPAGLLGLFRVDRGMGG